MTMQDRLDTMYDRIIEIEESIAEVSAKRDEAAGQQITVKGLQDILCGFSRMYSKMTDLEKKTFYGNIIKSIDVYPDESEDGKVLKHIDFKFPVGYSAEGDQKLLRNETTVETVCLLTHNG